METFDKTELHNAMASLKAEHGAAGPALDQTLAKLETRNWTEKELMNAADNPHRMYHVERIIKEARRLKPRGETPEGMSQKTIDAIASDAERLFHALKAKHELRTLAWDMARAAMPAIVEYETREGK